MHNKKNQIELAVDALPERYQPIFGYSELSTGPSRSCQDRLQKIVEIYRSLEIFYERPLRVLDLGCAQGFFCFELASLGATVTGVDYLDKNIHVCELIAQHHPSLETNFAVSRIEDILKSLEDGQYDLVLGLSVFHHLVHEYGLVYVQTLLGELAKKVPVGIFELALNSEPLYWAEYLPSDPKSLLSEFAFTHIIDHIQTHLSDVERPLVFASNKFWYLDGRLETFDEWTLNSHCVAPNVHVGTRRYYFSESHFVKHFEIKYNLFQHNFPEITNEISFHDMNVVIGNSPKLISSGCTENEGWIVTDRLKGRLLVDLIQEGSKIDHYHIIRSILAQLVELEKIGLYHNDVRTWNVMILEDGFAQLIDFGSISSVKEDCQWPSDLFLSFMILVHEVVSGRVEPLTPLRPIVLSPANMPEFYQPWATALWEMGCENWSFSLMLDLMEKLPNLPSRAVSEMPIDPLWCKSIEQVISMFAHQVRELTDVRSQIPVLTAELAEVKSQVPFLTAEMTDVKSQIPVLTAELAEVKSQIPVLTAELAEVKSQLISEMIELKSQLSTEMSDMSSKMNDLLESHQRWEILCNDYENELKKIRTSTSWKVTAPLRALKDQSLQLQNVISRKSTK